MFIAFSFPSHAGPCGIGTVMLLVSESLFHLFFTDRPVYLTPVIIIVRIIRILLLRKTPSGRMNNSYNFSCNPTLFVATVSGGVLQLSLVYNLV